MKAAKNHFSHVTHRNFPVRIFAARYKTSGTMPRKEKTLHSIELGCVSLPSGSASFPGTKLGIAFGASSGIHTDPSVPPAAFALRNFGMPVRFFGCKHFFYKRQQHKHCECPACVNQNIFYGISPENNHVQIHCFLLFSQKTERVAIKIHFIIISYAAHKCKSDVSIYKTH